MKSNLNKSNPKRRQFLRDASLAIVGTVWGGKVVYGANLPRGIQPLGLSCDITPYTLPGKDSRLTVLNDKPINAETPAHLLDDRLTPNDLFFVRNNGIPPKAAILNNWKLTIAGESVKKEMVLSMADLKSKFETVSYNLTLECGGNGRSEFNPPAKGNQWSLGAVGCAKWTGVRLRDVLNYAGIKSDAVYIGYYGADSHLSGDPNKDSISRGVPISKALEPESMIAWAMNNQPLPELNGYPLRLVFGGWPASCSGKWLEKIVIRNKVHDGQKMTGKAYRVPCNPIAPGAKVSDEDMCIIQEMPVKSIISYPKTGATIKLNQSLPIRGHAWSGKPLVTLMEYSIDFGSSWTRCSISSPANRHDWQHFDAKIKFPKAGYYEIWARATDSNGRAQPIILPGWNPKGYLNNACHRIAIKVV